PLFRSILALCPVNDLQFFVLIGQYKESRIRLPGKNRGLAGATNALVTEPHGTAPSVRSSFQWDI
ncbi:hypothetical protein, partial [Kushneria aurantia]